MAFTHFPPPTTKRLATVAAILAAGPCLSYLAWAVINKRLVHIGLAAALNAVLWIGGPVFVAHFGGLV